MYSGPSGDLPHASAGAHGLIASFGAGLRYQLSEADRSRIRIDYARGRHGGALYVALGEAF